MQFNQNPNVGILIQGEALPNFDYTKPVCVIGHKTSAGVANANEVYTINSAYDVDNMFGANSMLANATRLFKNNNTIVELKAVPLSDNGSGTATTLARTFSGTATSNGTLYYEVQGASYNLPISIGDTASDVASNLKDLIDADADVLVTAGVSTATITLTYRHKGNFKIKDFIKSNDSTNSSLPVAGISWSSATLTVGSGLANLTNAITAIKNLDCNFVIPVEYLLDNANQILLFAEIRRRLQVSDANDYKLINGFFIFSTQDTYADLTTDFATFNQNDLQRVIILAQKTSSNTNASALTSQDDLAISTMFASNETKIISDGVDTSVITPSQVVGNKNRVTTARGGMVLQSISANGKQDWVNFEFTEAQNLKKLGLTPLRQEATSVVNDEVYTMANPNNTNQIFRQYPIALSACVIQIDLYRELKSFAGLNLAPSLLNDIRAKVSNCLTKYTSIEYSWLQSQYLNTMLNELTVTDQPRTINGVTKKVAVISSKLYPTGPLEDLFTTLSFALI